MSLYCRVDIQTAVSRVRDAEWGGWRMDDYCHRRRAAEEKIPRRCFIQNHVACFVKKCSPPIGQLASWRHAAWANHSAAGAWCRHDRIGQYNVMMLLVLTMDIRNVPRNWQEIKNIDKVFSVSPLWLSVAVWSYFGSESVLCAGGAFSF